ncbi:MAG: DNA topoisomerase I [Candidatus Nanoarchaeia archaeon]|nr:DNA topoisomerase I [Candidatus Nanoarchaeia archaeon]
MVELLIAEKPSAMQKIAEALADTKPKKKFINKIAYYELEHKGKKILVGCAVGHLFGLEQKKKKGWTYPIFDVEWKPAYKSKKSAFSKPYFEALEELSKQADEFTVCTDYDEEGSVIGFNVIRYICNKKDGKRMKFSTLTKKELIESYENATKHLDFPQIEAGEARHILDWMYGINLSRALTLAIKQTGTFKIMSAGRVQGPALKVIVDREKEIQAFKPEPFWEIELECVANKKRLLAQHKEGKFQDKKQADQVLKNTKGKKASVEDVKVTEQIKEAPYPLDLTSLQMESYKVFGISPKETLSLAQDLYTAGLISYPRTSSQKLPIAIQYKEIIKQLQKFPEYEHLCSEVLKGKLKPNEGKKSDAAHPAIYPTAEQPKKLTERQHKLYDLIVKRFLATFGTPATRETVTVSLDVNKEIFVARGTRTTVPGWHNLYEPYVKLKDEEMPKLEKGEEIKVEKIDILEKETQPPKRYTPASIIKELEKKSLGTKATRASIVDALYERHYVNEKSIEATKLGMAAVETLEKYCPEILDEALTRRFEQETDEIRERTKKEAEVIKEAEVFLEKVLNKFKEHEKEIGEGLIKSVIETRAELNTVAPCKICNKGNLELRRGRFGLFVACNQYPDCKTTFSVPSNALVKPTEGECPHCNSPMVLVIRKGKRPFKYCISKTCPPKVAWIEEQKKKKEEADKIQKELQELPKEKKKTTKKVIKKKVSKKTKE